LRPAHRYLGLDLDLALTVFRYGFYVAAAAIALGARDHRADAAGRAAARLRRRAAGAGDRRRRRVVAGAVAAAGAQRAAHQRRHDRHRHVAGRWW
jgi:hypothetical protein